MASYSGKCYLINLPTEILQNIFFYLDSVLIFDILPRVCQRFQCLVNDKTFWKIKMAQRWKFNYPAFNDYNVMLDYKSVCISREIEEQRWKLLFNERINFISLKKNLETYSALTSLDNGRLVITGSREKTISLFDIENSIQKSSLITLANIPKSHRGWIWSLSNCDNMLVSGSFDTFLKFWDISTFQLLNQMDLQSAVLCSKMKHKEVVACGFNGYMHIIDMRMYADNFVRRIHTKPILDVISTENEIITIGEDSKLVILDRRKLQIRKRLILPECCITMSLDGNELWLGSVLGNIHLFGPINNTPSIVETFKASNSKIYNISHSSGSMMALDANSQLTIFEPCQRPMIMNSIYCKGNKFTYNNGILVSAGEMYLGIHYDKNIYN